VTLLAGPRLAGLVALVVALAATGWLISRPGPSTTAERAAPAAVEVSLRDVWPDARVVETPGRLVDDRAYTPWFHLDADVSVGTALTGDGNSVRLIVRSSGAAPAGAAPAGGAERELMRLPAADNPQFNGFAVAGDELVWMVSAGEIGSKATLYRADWRRGTPASVVTADTGDVLFFNSAYDVVVAGGRVHWATARAETAVTEIRSVPLGGGKVTVRPVDGAYALSGWPWLTSAGSSQSGPVELRNLDTGQRITVPGSPTELVTCGVVWCRVVVLGAAGQPARTDLMRPDGSDRMRMSGGGITSAVLDVALIDRFELLSLAGSGTGDGVGSNLKLILFDVSARRSVILATGVATVQARGPVVWWSTGDGVDAVVWHALDLRTLK
jgi:hypothetical protein